MHHKPLDLWRKQFAGSLCLHTVQHLRHESELERLGSVLRTSVSLVLAFAGSVTSAAAQYHLVIRRQQFLPIRRHDIQAPIPTAAPRSGRRRMRAPRLQLYHRKIGLSEVRLRSYRRSFVATWLITPPSSRPAPSSLIHRTPTFT